MWMWILAAVCSHRCLYAVAAAVYGAAAAGMDKVAVSLLLLLVYLVMALRG